MQIFKANNPKVAILLKDQLVSITVEELVERMICQEDRISVIIGVDGKEIIGHVIVLADMKNNTSYLLSGHIKAGVHRHFKEKVMEDIQKWLREEFGIREIKTDVTIKPAVWSRLFKDFELLSYTMVKHF